MAGFAFIVTVTMYMSLITAQESYPGSPKEDSIQNSSLTQEIQEDPKVQSLQQNRTHSYIVETPSIKSIKSEEPTKPEGTFAIRHDLQSHCPNGILMEWTSQDQENHKFYCQNT